MDVDVRWRRIPAILAFALILAGSFELEYVRMLFHERSVVGQAIDQLRFGKMPEIRSFLEAVEARTEPGDSVALVIPAPGWNQGYEYAFYRASYVLAGRTMLPMMNPAGTYLPSNLERADLVAAWRVELDPERFETVWSGHDGTLARPK